MADNKIIDIRKTGPQGFRQIQQQNNSKSNDSLESQIEAIKRLNPVTSAYSLDLAVPKDIESPLQQQGDWWGSSTYDKPVVNEDEYENLGEIRAENQPWYSKWGSAIGKLAGEIGTTFGKAVGMVYGLGDAIVEWDRSKIFNNEIVNTMSDVDEWLEENLPNYMTQWEQEAPWYQRLGTANFWANDILKNWGFTIGSLLTGQGWTSALKALNLVKGPMAAKWAGTLMSSLTEATVEANNTMRDFSRLEKQKIDDQVSLRAQEIMSMDIDDVTKQALLDNLDQQKSALYADADKRAEDAGFTTFLGNTALLVPSNMGAWGKVFGRGFDQAADATKGIRKTAQGYAYDALTNKEIRNRALRIGLIEGNEEMSQAFISETAGGMESYDSPDAYYKALTDPNAQLKTKSATVAMAEALNDTYFNPERWEEGFAGALMGLMGMPTVGKKGNSTAQTWLGKGRTIGLTGGFFGERAELRAANERGEDLANRLNDSRTKFLNRSNSIAQSTAFTDLMDGYAAENNSFEWHNAKDNDDFVAISRFAEAGRLDDLVEMINQDFDSLDEEGLRDIAVNTSPDIILTAEGTVQTKTASGNTATKGWRNADGTLMSDTEEGRQKMRESLNRKKESMLSAIQEYANSTEKARSILGIDADESQVNELAWLDWKQSAFTKRLDDIKDRFAADTAQVQRALSAFERGVGQGQIDKGSQEGQDILTSMKNIQKFVDMLADSKTALQLGALLEANPSAVSFLENVAGPIIEDIAGLDSITFDRYITALKDAAKIGKLAVQFNDKLKEYTADPTKLAKNREKIDKENARMRQESDKIKNSENLDNASVSDVVDQLENNDFAAEDLDSIFAVAEGEDATPGEVARAEKVKTAQEIISTSNAALGTLADLQDDPSITAQELQDATLLLNESKNSAESAEDILDLDSQVFNDPTAFGELLGVDDPELSHASTEAERAAILDERLTRAKNLVSRIKTTLNEASQEINDLSNMKPVGRTLGQELVTQSTSSTSSTSETGHDPVPTVKTENERADEEAKKQASDEQKRDFRSKVSQFVEESKEDVSNLSPEEQAEYADNVDKAVDILLKLLRDGRTNKEIGTLMKASTPYIRANALNPNLGTLLNTIITAYRKPSANTSQTAQEDIEPSTPVVGAEAVNAYIASIPEVSSPVESYDYWKPTQTQLPIHRAPTDNTPFYKIAAKLTNSNGTARYSKSQVQRIEAVGEYLDSHGAFEEVNKGIVQPGSTIKFFIDRALNEKAGEVVVLMVDENGQVLGDLMSPTLALAAKQSGLANFVQAVINDYEKAGSPETYTHPKYKTTVLENKIGKVPYSKERNTLNNIFTGSEMKLGLAMSDGPMAKMLGTGGRGRRLGSSDFDKQIMPANTAKNGQPFLLLKTSDKTGKNQWIPVPITMPVLSEETSNSALATALIRTLADIETADNASAIKVIEKLREILAPREWHINYSTGFDTTGARIKSVSVSVNLNGRNVKVFSGLVTNNTAVDIFQSLVNLRIPFQVSRRYINGQYNGQDYNRMIGELAQTNLPIGTTHTMSDWFTVKPIAPVRNTSRKQSVSSKNVEKLWSPSWRVQHSKLLNKDKILDAVISVKGGFEVTLNPEKVLKKDFFEDNPSATVVIYYDSKKKRLDLRVLHTSDENFFSAEDIQPIIDQFIPKELQEYINNGGLKEHDKAMVDLADRLREENSNISLQEIIAAQNKAPDRMRDEFGIYSYNEYTEETNYVVDTTVPPTGIWSEGLKQVRTAYTGQKLYFNPNVPGAEAWEQLKRKVTPEDIYNIQNEVSGDFLKYLNSAYEYATGEPLEAFVNQQSQLSPEEKRLDAAKKKGIVPNKNSRATWDNLKAGVQDKIIKAPDIVARQWMVSLSRAFNPATKQFDLKKLDPQLRGLLEGTNDTRYRKTAESYKSWNKEEELTWLEKALPQLSKEDRLRVVDGIERIVNNGKSEVVFGKFENGIVTLYTNAAEGTAYHEAFHFVAHTLLKEEELTALFKEAAEKWGIFDEVALEEKIAEDFRKYVQLEQTPVLGKAVKIYRMLANFFTKLFNKRSTMRQVFYDISRGNYANREVREAKGLFYNSALEGINEVIEKEMQDIRAKAIAGGRIVLKADGTFDYALAPNDKKSNLNERQWLQVRTKAFKDWFGDWINDSANASKVVDENGEPLVVYHGGSLVNVFDTTGNHQGLGAGIVKGDKGSYFTSSLQSALQYESIFKDKVENSGILLNELQMLDMRGMSDEEIDKEYNNGSLLALRNGTRAFFLSIKNPKSRFYTGVPGTKNSYTDSNVGKNDGQIITGKEIDGTEYVAFDPNQIKSATDNIGTFDPNNPDIRYRWFLSKTSTREENEAFMLNYFGNTLHDDIMSDIREAEAFVEEFNNKTIRPISEGGDWSNEHINDYLTRKANMVNRGLLDKDSKLDVGDVIKVTAASYDAILEHKVNNYIKNLSDTELASEVQRITSENYVEPNYSDDIVNTHNSTYYRATPEEESMLVAEGVTPEEYAELSPKEQKRLLECL